MKPRINNLSLMTLSEIEAKGLAHLIIQNKKIKRPTGRPRKLPDRQYQFSLSYWYGLIAADYHKLSKIQRVRVALECWKTLINRMKTIPSDPQESKLNAEEAMRMLSKLEGNDHSQEEGGKVASQRPADGGPEPDVALEGVAATLKVPVREDASNLNGPEAAA